MNLEERQGLLALLEVGLAGSFLQYNSISIGNGRATLKYIRAENSPKIGVDSFCTYGLSSSILEGQRFEILAGCRDFVNMAHLLGVAVEHLVFYNIAPTPGRTLSNIVMKSRMDFIPNVNFVLKHAIFVPPSAWPQIDNPIVVSTCCIRPVCLLLISDQELEYRKTRGFNAFTQMLTKGVEDIFDLERVSAI